MSINLKLICFGLSLLISFTQSLAQGVDQVNVNKRIVLLVDEIKAIRSFPVVLAERLGYFRQNGFDVMVLNIRDDVFHDQLLKDGRVDAVMAYYHHNIVNHSKSNPTQSIISLGVTPGMRVLVANQVREKYKSLKDLKGSRILTGGDNSSKTTVANFLMIKAGLELSDYTRLPTYGKEKNLEMLKNGDADLVIAPNPEDDYYLQKNVASVLFDLTTVDETKKVLGAVLPTNTIFMSTKKLQEHPEMAQHLAGAFVKTLKFIQEHSPEEIAEVIPVEISGKDRSSYLKMLKQQIPMYANNGLMSKQGADLEYKVFSTFNSKYKNIDTNVTYTNQFVIEALK